MEINIDKRKKEINLQYNQNLSFWDLVFWQNNNIQLNDNSKLKEELNSQIKQRLDYFYSLDKNYFEIKSVNNPEIERSFNNEVSKLRNQGNAREAMILLKNEAETKQNNADNFAEKQFAEFKHIVNSLKNENYSDSFKCLILNETLTKIYKTDFSLSTPKLLVKDRIKNQSIDGLMALSSDVIENLYDNAQKYTSFKNLYLDAQKEFNKKIARLSEISLDEVETFGKGHWIKFDGLNTNKEEYPKNVERLKSLVADTPWCTSALAGQHLEDGDFYVFVDNKNKPHIAVKMNGNSIDEVRGVQGGFTSQELEEDYRDVALSFLENNKNIENGVNWLEKEEWNKRLIEYNHQIKQENFDDINMEQLFEDLTFNDYKVHFQQNSNFELLNKNLPQLKPVFAKYYGCTKEEISVGNEFEESILPYKVIIGNIRVNSENHFDYDKLKCVVGDFDATFSDITIPNLEYVFGELNISFSRVKELPKLKFAKKLDVRHTMVEQLESLEKVGSLEANGAKLKSLSNLKTAEKIDVHNSIFSDLKNLERVGELWAQNSLLKDLDKLKSADEIDISKTLCSKCPKLQSVETFMFDKRPFLPKLKSAQVVCKVGINGNIQNISKEDFLKEVESDRPKQDFGN